MSLGMPVRIVGHTGYHRVCLCQRPDVSINPEVRFLIRLFLLIHPRLRRHSAPPEEFILLPTETATKSSN